MNAADKAWLKRRKTNVQLHEQYVKREAQAIQKLDKAGLRTMRAVAYYARARNERNYLKRLIEEVSAAIRRGETYPVRKEKKKKQGRRIEL